MFYVPMNFSIIVEASVVIKMYFHDLWQLRLMIES